MSLKTSEKPSARAEIFDTGEAQCTKTDAPIIIIGAGPVGVRCAQEILTRCPNAQVRVFGNEPVQPYNRVKLSPLLAGELSYQDIFTELPARDAHPGFAFVVATVRAIDREQQCVIDSAGKRYAYSKLVIATGSRPHRPGIPGIEQQGVFTFRNLGDTEHLSSRVSRARSIVVVGGGLLGLEAARALCRYNTDVTLIQQGPRLMNRQLDDVAASRLQRKVEALGIRVIVNSGVLQVLGAGRVSGVVTRDKETINCDTVLLCAGIKPNIELALQARLPVGRGISVNDSLQTSDDNIFAIGECCEHNGQIYGLVAPGYEQAAICAEILAAGVAGGAPTSTDLPSYHGSLEVSRLKVVGEAVCSMGEVDVAGSGGSLKAYCYRDDDAGLYRKIVLRRGRLAGVLAFGEWPQVQRAQEAFQKNRRIWPWQRYLLQSRGRLFGLFSAEDHVSDWPASAVVCQCNNVAQGEILAVAARCNNDLAEVQACTRAGTVCGSCKPLLNELLGSSTQAEKEKAWLPHAALSLLTLLVATLFITLPAQQPADSVQAVGLWESIWHDKFYKQVTGFSLLGMAVLGLAVSVRKRMRDSGLGDYAYWRVFHIALGFSCALGLFLHTGMHLGQNWNQALMLNFLAVLLLGALAGGVIALSHRLRATSARSLREFWRWLHLLVAWPLPVLLTLHIFTVYYY